MLSVVTSAGPSHQSSWDGRGWELGANNVAWKYHGIGARQVSRLLVLAVGWGHYYIITQNQWRDANVECHRSVAVWADGAGCVCEFALVSSNYY